MSALYRQVGVETSVTGASPHQLNTLLLNGFFDAVAEGRGAMKSGQIELKCKALGRAIRIVEEGLKAALDFQAGGEIAQNLSGVYSYICVRLTQANLKNDEAVLDECVQLMTPIREAWIAIGPQANAAQGIKKEVLA